MENDANSFPCKICGTVFSEESGAFPGFVCEDCQEAQEQQ